jgi:hypothetical protein
VLDRALRARSLRIPLLAHDLFDEIEWAHGPDSSPA